MKTHWNCMASVRGTASPGCHRKFEAGVDGHKALRQAGWRQVDTQNKRVFYKCPACIPRKAVAVSNEKQANEEKERLRLHWHKVYRRLRHAYFAGDLPMPAEIQDHFDNNEFELAFDALADGARAYGVLGDLRREFWKSMQKAAELMELEDKAAAAKAELDKSWRCAVCEPLPGRGGVEGDGDGVCGGCTDAIRGLLQTREFGDKQVYALLKQAFRHRDVLYEAKKLIRQANQEAGAGD